MGSYYNEVAEEIKKSEKNLIHLQDELKILRSVKNDTPSASYQRQHSQILYHIDQEQRRLKENKWLIDSYDKARSNMQEIKELQETLATENDSSIRKEIAENIEKKENEVNMSMLNLTDELGEELKNSFNIEQEKVEKQQNNIEEPSIVNPEETPDQSDYDITEKINVILEPETSTTARSIDARNLVISNDERKNVKANQKIKVKLKKVPHNGNEQEGKTPGKAPEDMKEALISVQESNLGNENKDSREQALEESLANAKEEYLKAENAYKESIEKLQSIFAEERTKVETEDLFKTEAELDSFTNEYMRQKIEENEHLEAARIKMKREARKIKTAENKLSSYQESKNEATARDIDINVYSKIKKTAERSDVLNAIYKEKGLGEVSRRSKAEKTQVKQVTDEVINKVIEQLKQSGILSGQQTNGINEDDINVIDAINLIYGTDIPVQAGKARTTTINTEEKDNVVSKQNNKIQIKETPKVEQVHQQKDNNQDYHVTTNVQPDGKYRLTRDQIIQDEVIRKDNKEQTPDNKVKPQGLVPVEPKPQGLVPVEPKPQGLVPIEPKPQGLVPAEPKPQGVVPGKEKPKPKPQPKPPEVVPGQEKPKQKPKRGLLQIMDELTTGLELKTKDGKRYTAANIKVAEGFKNELKSGNYLYNIVHVVPAIVKLPFKLLQKISGKIMLRHESKENIKQLKERIAKLSEEDIETIYHEYRGNRVIQEKFPSILNTLLEDKMQKYAMGKVTKINSELEQRYKYSFIAIKELEAIDRKLSDPNTPSKVRQQLKDSRAKLLKGQAENISAIRSGYIKANEWMSGGAHGFSEDMKAAATKLSVVGKRFAKEHDLDNELLHKQAQLEKAENIAIATGNDEMALRTFIQAETLLSKNTEISNSVFGKRSTGKKYYSPLAEQLDYRDDPFIRDLFTTIAVSSAAISTMQSIQAANTIQSQNNIINQNNTTMNQVNQIGKDIAGKRDEFMDGIEAQGMQDTLTAAGEIERGALDLHNWQRHTKAYAAADTAGHTYYTDFTFDTKQAFEDIATQYGAGQITQQQAMSLMKDITQQTHQTLEQINDTCLNIMKPYAATHPQFDLTGVQEAMTYLKNNPDAIDIMNQAMIDVTNAGDILASMKMQQLLPLTQISNNLCATIVNAAATAALADNIYNGMAAKKHEYGNEVTDMVEEYIENETTKNESKNNTSSK